VGIDPAKMPVCQRTRAYAHVELSARNIDKNSAMVLAFPSLENWRIVDQA
jgi:hypothetical protein